MEVPERVRHNVLELHKAAGANWLAQIPELLEACAAKWSLVLGAPYAGSYSVVVRAERADGSPAVLKLSFPDSDAEREVEALNALAGRGCVRLLAHDPATSAILLERAEPGHQLARLCSSDDERATSIAAGLLRAIRREAQSQSAFPSPESWLTDLHRALRDATLTSPIRHLVRTALKVLVELSASPRQNFLLHGDLHQFNILAAGEGWLAVDPKGLVGEPECEIAPLVLNPVRLGWRLQELLNMRIDRLCDEADLDRERAYPWTFVRVVLAILWSYEDHRETPAAWLACADVLWPHPG